MQRIKIGKTCIGENCPVFIIAEAGVNHNGSLKIAKQLIDAAKDAGADAVKFQTFKTENVITRNAEKAKYQKDSGAEGETQFDMVKKLELSAHEFRELSDYCWKKGIMFLSSPFDIESVDLLADIGVPAFKIASGEITNFPLMKRVAEKGKPIILSTGMSSLDEVAEAVEFLRKAGSGEIILLHCTSEYPAKFGDVNLRAMATMKNAFGLPVGFSDHTPGIVAPIAAAALGACIIEKHFTLDKGLPGPDHKASLSPDELKRMVLGIRNVEKAMGDGKKEPRNGEEEIRKVARKSIVAAVPIIKGQVIKEVMLAIKRPGTGLEPKKIALVVGKIAKRNISADEMISLDMIK
jgi:N-acetylneuraminate synthase/N,N'-diacetyllegionaminate synthase